MKNNVPGMDVPDEMIEPDDGIPKEKQAEEGITICVETIARLRNIKGVSGIHIMAIEWEEKVAKIVELPDSCQDQRSAVHMVNAR